MLVCVKELVEVTSFEEARNSKEWLTTSEAARYIASVSPVAARALCCRYGGTYPYYGAESKRRQEEENERKKWKDYQEKAKGKNYHYLPYGVPYQNMYSMLKHITVKDNANQNVKFYNIGTIKDFIQREEEDDAKGLRAQKELAKQHIQENVGRSRAARYAVKFGKTKADAVRASRTTASSASAQSFTVDELLAAAKKHNMTVTFENGKLTIAA